MKNVALLLALLTLAACQSPVVAPDRSAPGSDRYAQQHDSGPADRNAALETADPTPVYEPRSKYGNHSPYKVYGVSYTVLDHADGYVAEGIASWYGSKFQGYRTSSGEPYDMYKLTAAHRTLPLPTWARVTNLDNGKSTIVRVNDRGPFHSERLIDLSWAAAVKIGIADRGTGRVRVEAITVPPGGTAAPRTVAAALPSPPPSDPGLYLQLGAFSQLGSAQNLVSEVTGRFQWPAAIRPAGNLYRVWLGPFDSASGRDRARQQVTAAGFQAVNAAP